LNKQTKQKALNFLKIYLKITCIITLAIGILFTIVMIYPLGGIFDTIAMGIAQVSGFLLFLYLLTTILFLKLTPKKKIQYKLKRTDDVNFIGPGIRQKNMTRNVIIVIGLSLVIVNSLPLLLTPLSIQNAEAEFEDAYGENWRDDIPDHIKSFFLPSQFNLIHYFLGVPSRECNIDTDIEYYSEGKEGDDDYLSLRFDVYYPKATKRELPGHNSTIIKIHGGGWVQGDKSIGNMLTINKYLAAQGYIVFDIQYGLLDQEGTKYLPTPDEVKGDFTLHDMIFHIGYFTKQLEHKLVDRYQCRLDSVFVMGGSAGGHLTGVFGLGYNDDYFKGNFSEALTIKGIVPYYPANDAEFYFTGDLDDLIPGDPDSNPLAYKKFTPSKLADKDDPSALIFQGLQDGLVPLKNSKDIEEALEAEGVNALLLTFPLAAHANDFMINNNFAQVFLYYLERFLYLEQL